MTITTGRTIPPGPTSATPGAVPGFTLVEMDTPEGIPSGAAFNVTVKFSGNPAQPVWPLIRDSGTGTFKIELFAESVGPSTELSLNGPAGAVGALTATVDDYNVPIAVAAGTLTEKGVYEIGAVITFTNNGTIVGGLAAFAGDALMLVH